MTDLLLASASPQRARLLKQLGLDFRIEAATIDESPQPGEKPMALVTRLARCKAQALADKYADWRILGSDTVVAHGSRIFGKPDSLITAREMLTTLGGSTHQVITGVALWHEGRLQTCAVTSQVTLQSLNTATIDQYWATGEPAGAAGAYAIQGLGAQFITHLEGSYSAVMGLPIRETAQLLQASGLDVLAQAHKNPS